MKKNYFNQDKSNRFGLQIDWQFRFLLKTLNRILKLIMIIIIIGISSSSLTAENINFSSFHNTNYERNEEVMTELSNKRLKDYNKEVVKTINGKIVDNQGDPLPGVSILVKGTSRGTTSDFDGNFFIEVSEEDILVFSFIGYKTIEISVKNQSTLNISMEIDLESLNEVVIIGYGVQEKVNLTGAVSSVNSEDLEGRVPTNLLSTLQGKMSGVTITQSSGQPGKTDSQIIIRGLGTMNNSSPLVLVDGIESSLNEINPHDIKSVNVLKDASSASIYGTRGANGVILITTERGKSGEISVKLNTSVGWQKPTSLPKKVSSAVYARLANEANINEGLAPQYSNEDIAKYESGSDPFNYPNTDWLDLLMQGSGLTQDYNMSVSGGGETAQYFLSLGYFNQEGIIREKSSIYKRKNIRLNVDSEVTSWFKVGVNGGVSSSDTREPAGTLNGTGFDVFYQMATQVPPTIPVTNEEGEYVSLGNDNLVALIDQGGNIVSEITKLTGSVFGEATILPNLTLKSLMGVDYSFIDTKQHYIEFEYADGRIVGPSQVKDILDRTKSVNLQSYLTYAKEFSKNKLKLMVGVSRQSDEFKFNSVYRRDFPSNLLDQIDAGSQDGSLTSGSMLEVRLGSYFGRFTYNYDDRYLFEASFRRDGSSKFAAENRWGNFPSFSAGWRISEEKFLEGVSWINNLKLRGSWGKLGNDRIQDYAYLSKITLGRNYPFGGQINSGATQTVAEVPEIGWESSTMIDIGLDASLFNDKISTSIGYYNRFTEDILTAVPVSSLYGLPAPLVNSGAMRNKGIELELTHKNNLGDFKYQISGNLSKNKNTVEKFPNESLGRIWGYRFDGTTIRREGESWDSFYGYDVAGIFQTDDEALSSPHITGTPVRAGDLKFKDQNGDGVIDSKDRVILGNQIPEITYGFTLDLNYKAFDMSVFFQGAANVYGTPGIITMFPFKDTNGAVLQQHLDRTIVENGQVIQQGHYPRTLLGGDSHHNAVFSSFWVSDASYLRLKNLQIGYTLPTKISDKLSIKKARIYFSGENLLTITSFEDGFDPEIRSGVGHWTYPQTKIYSFGLTLNF